MHKSAGAIIKNEKGEILMIERKIFPPGWACPAGHVDEGESSEEAMIREAREEVGLNVNKCKLLIHEVVDWNKCSKGIVGHDWYVYEVLDYEGEVKRSEDETKNFKWVSEEELKKLKLEKVWKLWFNRLSIL